jgi:hypothetical protein
MRMALGQLLEYAFRVPNDDIRTLPLIMVGRSALGGVDQTYLYYLKSFTHSIIVFVDSDKAYCHHRASCISTEFTPCVSYFFWSCWLWW